MAGRIPSAAKLLQEALQSNLDADVNTLHSRTFQLMIFYRSEYYESRVNSILSELSLPLDIHEKVKKKLLEPIVVGDKKYSNFMEEVSRRVSQVFQPISGNLAELCAERELIRFGLRRDVHYTRKKERTDIIVYYPALREFQRRHRVEVKNVSLRERATRGLAFDGDSLFGFFNQLGEFTRSNVDVLDALCKKTGGYCYLPPSTLEALEYRGERFRPNTDFGSDMAEFVKKGGLP
jgi:hypothetical protein